MTQNRQKGDGDGHSSNAGTTRVDPILADLGEVARAAGTECFYPALLRVYGRLAQHAIITVVRYNRFSKPDFLFHRNFSDELVQVYLDGFFELDPFYHYWLEHERAGVVPLHELPSGELKRRRYTAEIMRRSHIRDELAMFLPPIARSSVAVVLERTDGTFRAGEVERIRRLYPIMAGIHDAHVKCTFASLGGTESEFGPNTSVPTAVIDASGDTVFTNERWRTLEADDPELRRAMNELATAGDTRIDISGQRVLHRTALEPEFTLAPGGWLYRVERLTGKPSIEPPRRVFARRYPNLSARELDIVELILRGGSNRQIATHLSLSHGTIKNYRRRLYDKLGISTERELFLLHIGNAFYT